MHTILKLVELCQDKLQAWGTSHTSRTPPAGTPEPRHPDADLVGSQNPEKRASEADGQSWLPHNQGLGHDPSLAPQHLLGTTSSGLWTHWSNASADQPGMLSWVGAQTDAGPAPGPPPPPLQLQQQMPTRFAGTDQAALFGMGSAVGENGEAGGQRYSRYYPSL
jgi:hypothetical protein